MVNLNEFYEKEDNWKIINDHLIVKTSDKEDGSNNDNFFASVITLDDKQNFKNYIKISIILKSGAILKIPSIIRVRVCRIDGRDSNHSLVINRLADKTTIVTDEINGEQTIMDNDSYESDKIYETIINYINSFDSLKNNTDVKNGLDMIYPSLMIAINKCVTLWSSYYINEYIKKQEAALRLKQIEFQTRMKEPIEQIAFLKRLVKNQENKK